MKDSVNNQAQFTEQPDGLDETDKMARVKSLAVAAARTSALYIFALDIQAQLRSSSAIVRPVMLQKIMSAWATELNLALCRYHEELVKRKNEMQLNGERLLNSETKNGENNEDNNGTSLEGHEFKDEKRFISKSKNSVFLDDSNLMASQENQNMTSSINASSPSNSHETLTQSLFSDETPEYKNLTPTYWFDVMHCDDPFLLPTKHLDVIRILTTMCFVSGATGDILSYCNFTEEGHFRNFVQAVLPPSVYESFNPDCTCLISFFPGQHIPDHSSHQHNRRNLSTNVTDGKQNQSSGALIEDAAGSRQKAAEVSQNDVLQEFHSSSSNSSLSLHEVKSKNSPVYDNKSKLCFCKSNSKSWKENEVLKQDVSMALFIRQFFFALDYEKVKQTLEKQKSRMFISWASLVLCCRGKYF